KIHTCDALPTNSAEYIQNSVTALIEQNENYAASISEKDSLLRAIFLQSRMRDIYVSIEDVENQIDISQTYVMLYMRVHYKEEFYQSIQEEQGKSTFFLKQLIELYLGTAKMSATTFQIENDQIVSIISTSDEQEVMDSVHTMIKKLDNESDYVFFTIVVSHLHDDVGALKANFDKMSEIARYAKPRMETQVLIEDEQRQGAGNFHFTIEQMEKLSALMQNDPLGDSLQNVAEIFEYNERKDISGFGLYLLSTEIVNCCLKLVNRLFHVMPPSIKVSQIYAQLDRAVTVEQHQRICTDLVRDVVEYIKLNKRDEDYIISFILGYVEEHYAEDIYLNLFAEKLKLTAAYISSYFKEKMNVNLSDYINSYRIKKAISLIENPQNKNKDIAEMVGLQNINTFIRLFKKYTGYTPGEYKKKHFSE
ncbi:MAG: AraC family transcriptional regulator, partial [Clostridia bacterium]